MKFLRKLITRALLLVILLDLVYISILWFQHNILIEGKVPVSSFMQKYQKAAENNDSIAKMKWSPVPISSLSSKITRVFLIAEDTHFYVHHGFDVAAIQSVLQESFSKSSISRGASTITQQTAKNLYLYPERSWLRKWHELIFTLLLELTQRKERILELYLNIAEFGRGVYGINAASNYYFGLPANAISTQQAAFLAAALPWPQRHNFKTGSKTFHTHAKRIYARSRKEHLPTRK